MKVTAVTAVTDDLGVVNLLSLPSHLSPRRWLKLSQRFLRAKNEPVNPDEASYLTCITDTVRACHKTNPASSP